MKPRSLPSSDTRLPTEPAMLTLGSAVPAPGATWRAEKKSTSASFSLMVASRAWPSGVSGLKISEDETNGNAPPLRSDSGTSSDRAVPK